MSMTICCCTCLNVCMTSCHCGRFIEWSLIKWSSSRTEISVSKSNWLKEPRKYREHISTPSYWSLLRVLLSVISDRATGIEIADGVKKAMEDLFNEYKIKYSTQESGPSGTSSLSNLSAQGSNLMESQNTNRLMDKFKKRRTGVILGEKSELDKYLSEDVEEADESFDILVWWKANSARFPILARIARDVLAIPISTVASESAFSTGGRILDSFRSSLSPHMVEALICAQDWIKKKNCIDVDEDNDFAEKLECAISKLSLATNE